MPVWKAEHKQLVETALYRLAAQLLPGIAPAALNRRLEQPGASIDLFNGSAGVILYCLRLYEYSRQPGHLQTCVAAADTLLAHPAAMQQQYFTLYTGATGLLYLCIKMYEAVREEKYLTHALLLLQHYEQGIMQQVVQDDFLSGHAGNIFALTYLHAYTGHEKVRALVKQLADKMIQQARIAPQGLRWGHVKKSYDCLTGFSHGASGIAYALLQAAQYFNDEGLRYLAAQAWQYEMLYYDASSSNWLDLRLTSTPVPDADIMDWQIAGFHKYASNVNSWAHGAAGVGLARLYAWQAGAGTGYRRQVQLALRRCLRDARLLKRGDFTLCSGYGGIVMFLLKAAHVLNRPQLAVAARQLAVAAVQYYHAHGTYNSYIPGAVNDTGLFSGLAGVGYMLASVLQPYRDDAVTHPAINTKRYAAPLYEEGAVKRQLFSRYYGRSMALAAPGIIERATDVNALERLLQQHMPGQDCFVYEQCITAMWRQHKGLLCYLKRNELLETMAAQLLQAADEVLLQTVFIPVSNLQLCITRRPWHLPGATDMGDTGTFYYIHYSHAHGVSTFPVNRFAALLLQAFMQQKPLQAIIDYLVNTQPGAVSQPLAAAVLQQVRAFLQQYFIVKQDMMAGKFHL